MNALSLFEKDYLVCMKCKVFLLFYDDKGGLPPDSLGTPGEFYILQEAEAKFANKPLRALKVIKDKYSPLFLCSACSLHCNQCKAEIALIPLAVKTGQEKLRGKILIFKKSVHRKTPQQREESSIHFDSKEVSLMTDMKKKFEKLKSNFEVLLEVFESLEAKQRKIESFIESYNKLLRLFYSKQDTR